MSLIEDYAAVAGEEIIERLRQLAREFEGRTVVHVNSTRTGGGVAEILAKLVPLSRELGIDARWEVIAGEGAFYECTKAMHNALQGSPVDIPPRLWQAYENTNAANADALRERLEEADFVIIHDPQPALLLRHCPNRKGKWIWRCHIDVSRPHRPVWRYMRPVVSAYDASVFSLAAFAHDLGHPAYVVPPSIDPLGAKNGELPDDELVAVRERFGLDPERRLIAQISRFDRFKDPVGVIQAYRLTRRFAPGLQLVLAGGGAADDPEGAAVLEDVRAAAGDDADIHVLELPPNDDRTVNALQRLADIVLQKSTREGFGLTVTEAMWKGRPVIGGDTGGIRLQIFDHRTGFRVSTPEGAALRLRYLFHHRELAATMGVTAREYVRNRFLITRQLREYLTLQLALLHDARERIEIG